jgi:hypothetical protein
MLGVLRTGKDSGTALPSSLVLPDDAGQICLKANIVASRVLSKADVASVNLVASRDYGA